MNLICPSLLQALYVYIKAVRQLFFFLCEKDKTIVVLSTKSWYVGQRNTFKFIQMFICVKKLPEKPFYTIQKIFVTHHGLTNTHMSLNCINNVYCTTHGEKSSLPFFYGEILLYIAKILIYLLSWNATPPFKFYSGL